MSSEVERESMLRKRTQSGTALLSNEDCDVIQLQMNPTNNQLSGACTGYVKSVNILVVKSETDQVGYKQNGICNNSSKKSLNSMSRFKI